MTQIRKKTLEMLERLPEEKMIYVFNFLQNIEALSMNGEIPDTETPDDAFATLMKYSRTLPEDFDYKAELEAMSKSATVDRERAVDALQSILAMEKRLPDDFDPDKELMEALDEKYGSVD